MSFKRGITCAKVKIANLKNRVEIGFTQLVEAQLKIRYLLSWHNAKWVQLGLLVAPLTIGGNQLHHPNLLALVFCCLRVMGNGGLGTNTHLADFGELVPQR